MGVQVKVQAQREICPKQQTEARERISSSSAVADDIYFSK